MPLGSITSRCSRKSSCSSFQLSSRGGRWTGLEWAAEIELIVAISVYNGGFWQESRRSGRVTFRKNFFSPNIVYVNSFKQNFGMVYNFRHGGWEKCLDGKDLPRTEGVCTRERLRVSGWSNQRELPTIQLILFPLWYSLCFGHWLRRYLGQSC